MLKHYPDARTIFDPFCGSGSILMACEHLGRRCQAIEINTAFCAVILERFKEATGKQPRLIELRNVSKNGSIKKLSKPAKTRGKSVRPAASESTTGQPALTGDATKE
jgi:DNA modification methylase